MHESTAKVMKKKKSGEKGKVREIHLRRTKTADGKHAVMATMHHENMEDPEAPWGGGTSEMVHTSSAAMKKHVASVMFPDTNDEEAEEDEHSKAGNA
jgi:hypothetical protein